MAKLTEKVSVVDVLSQSLSDARSRIEKLNSEMDRLKAELYRVGETYKKVDDIEQYQRRNNLRVFWIPEAQGQNTDDAVLGLLKDKLAIDLPLERVERSHQVGESGATGDDGIPCPRPIIVKFASYWDRQEVFSKKKALKGTGFTIREDLM